MLRVFIMKIKMAGEVEIISFKHYRFIITVAPMDLQIASSSLLCMRTILFSGLDLLNIWWIGCTNQCRYFTIINRSYCVCQSHGQQMAN